jgi:hypothetical protein
VADYQVVTEGGDFGPRHSDRITALSYAKALDKRGLRDVNVIEYYENGCGTVCTNPREPSHTRFKTLGELLYGRR